MVSAWKQYSLFAQRHHAVNGASGKDQAAAKQTCQAEAHKNGRKTQSIQHKENEWLVDILQGIFPATHAQ